jgi:hypothetical protein
MSGQLRFGWVVGESAATKTSGDIVASGGTVEDARPHTTPGGGVADFEPLTMIVAVMAVVALAERIHAFVKDIHHNGLIIDKRTDPITIMEHPSSDRGKVLVIGADGESTFDLDDRPDLTDLLAQHLR